MSQEFEVNWLIYLVAASALAFSFCSHNKERASIKKDQSEKAAYAACSADPACSKLRDNDYARNLSESFPMPIYSGTSDHFFRGRQCIDDCSGHVAGYNWAKDRGISKVEGCYGKSISFRDGCLIYVDERLLELSNTRY
jgi:hypothetical protein